MLECEGHIWSVRQATAADAGAIADLVGASTAHPRQEGFSAAALLETCPTLRILFRDGAAVGLCGVEGPQSDGSWEAQDDIEFRVIVFLGDELDDTAAAEAADRLVRELALSVDLPVGDTASQPGFCLAAL